MRDKARRIRVINHLYPERFFCGRPCALTFAIAQAADQQHEWCSKCQTWATDYCPCKCERDGVLDILEKAIGYRAVEGGGK